MENKLTEIGFPYEHKHIAYENMSHVLFTKIPFIYKIGFKCERNNVKGCASDRENMKQELLSWVRDIWK
jgi:hypothetical protein